MKKIIILIISVIMLTGCGAAYQTISAVEVKNLIDDGAKIIDVRTMEEYNEGHIASSINIPVDRIEEISYQKDETIIVYCASGVRSATAAKELISLGYNNVYNLDGGLINWGYGTE